MSTEKEYIERYKRCDHMDKSEFVDITCARCKNTSRILICEYCSDPSRADKLICYDCVKKVGNIY